MMQAFIEGIEEQTSNRERERSSTIKTILLDYYSIHFRSYAISGIGFSLLIMSLLGIFRQDTRIHTIIQEMCVIIAEYLTYYLTDVIKPTSIQIKLYVHKYFDL